MFSEYEMVRLKRPQSGLESGAVGTIVMAYDSVQPGYEVEFADATGVTIALLTLYDDDLEAMAQPEDQKNHGTAK